jgi:predicted nucleic acid-binding protein
MILCDSSVWINHFRHGNVRLAELLENDQALCHPFIIGELACGALPTRRSTIELLHTLPEAPLMEHEEVLVLIERQGLMASGIGWIDAHLLGSALLANARLWTFDLSLGTVARKLGVEYRPNP